MNNLFSARRLVVWYWNFLQYYTEKDETSNKSSLNKAEEEEALVESQSNGRSALKVDTGNIQTDTATNNVGHISNVESTLLITSDDKESEPTSTFAIISKIWVWIATIFITFVVCLSVFPSVTAIVESTEKGKVSFVSVKMKIYPYFNINITTSSNYLIVLT